MADELSNIQSLSAAVDSLTQKVNELYDAVSRVKGVAGSTITDVKGMINTQGGQLGLGNAARMQMPTQASFSTPSAGGQQGNILQNSLGSFSHYNNSDAASVQLAQSGVSGGGNGLVSGVTNIVGGVMKMAAAPAAGLYAAMPDMALTMQREVGYYQAGLRGNNINRTQLEKQTLKAMGGGLSSLGSDAAVAAMLGGRGYTVGSANYYQAAAEVGGAYKNLGMDNAAAASAIAGLHSGPQGANLYQYGIDTYDPKTGRQKSTGDIAKQLLTTMTGGRKLTLQQLQNSYQMGNLGANLRNMGLDQSQQDLIYSSMVQQVGGKSGDLAKSDWATKGNNNTPLTAAGRINDAQTKLMTAAAESMTAGFNRAAQQIEIFNKGLEALGPAMKAAAYTKGDVSGVGGSNMGKSLVTTASMLKSGLSQLTQGIDGIISALKPPGGGTSGYGAAIGGGKSGTGAAIGGGAAVSAGFGDKNNDVWKSSNGSHTGVDIPMKDGTPVSAKMGGKVIQVNINKDYGNSVLIDSGTGYQELYAHLSSRNVQVGDMVASGTVIGKSGHSGNASGPHLHYELRNGKNNPVDPAGAVSGGLLTSGGTAALLAKGVQGAYDTVPGTVDPNANSGYSSDTSSGNTSGNKTPYKGSGNYDKSALSDKALQGVLSQAGFSGQALQNAMKVVRAESGGRPGALNPNANTGDYSMGLFQINMIGDLGTKRNESYLKTYKDIGYKGPESLNDPLINAKIAFDISKSGTKWSDAWVNTSNKLNLGGGASGFGGGTMAATGSSTPVINNTFNMPITLQNGSDAELQRVATRVKEIIHQSTSRIALGAS